MIAPETPLLTDAELAEIPVFPLPRAVLFPGVAMGLHLFEPRYRAMMRHCLDQGPRAMVIAQLLPGFEADYEHQPAIYEVASAGRIVSHRGNPDGTFDLILEATQRVRLRELPFSPPFRRARAETLRDQCTDDVALRRVIESMGLNEVLARIARTSATPMPPSPLRGSASRMIDNAIDQLVRDPAMRQELLETLDVDRRILMVRDLVIGDATNDRRKRAN